MRQEKKRMQKEIKQNQMKKQDPLTKAEKKNFSALKDLKSEILSMKEAITQNMYYLEKAAEIVNSLQKL